MQKKTPKPTTKQHSNPHLQKECPNFQSSQRCKHVNSCDIVLRWESLPSAPIRAPVFPAASPTELHLPAIMNCQHRSPPHLSRPNTPFSSFCIFPFCFSHSQSEWMNTLELSKANSVVSELYMHFKMSKQLVMICGDTKSLWEMHMMRQTKPKSAIK